MFKRRILIIDNDYRYTDYLHSQLSIEGFDVCVVYNINEAMASFEGPPLPELIFAGLQPLKAEDTKSWWLQQQEKTMTTIPLVLLYPNQDKVPISDKLRCYYLPKYPPEKLIVNISLFLSFN